MKKDIQLLYDISSRVETFTVLLNDFKEDNIPEVQAFFRAIESTEYFNKCASLEKSIDKTADNLDKLFTRIPQQQGSTVLEKINFKLYDPNIALLTASMIPEDQPNIFLSLFNTTKQTTSLQGQKRKADDMPEASNSYPNKRRKA